MASATTMPTRTPDDLVRTDALRALIAVLAGAILAPVAALAPALALGTLLRIHRRRDVLRDPSGARRLARVALALGTIQVAAFAGYAILVAWALVG